MTTKPKTSTRRVVVAAFSAIALLTTAGASNAQSYRDMSCDELWYERNLFYAQKGYCFKTARARAVFKDACFPPYGELDRWEQEQVELIRGWERRKGC